MTPKLKFLQVESIRSGTAAYKPRSSKPFTDLTSASTQSVTPNFSDHATYVAGYWQADGNADLVAEWFICEQSNFELNLVKPGRSFDPAALKGVHLVIMPCGESWEGVSNLAINLLQSWAAANNALILKSPPDLNQGFYQSPCQATGANILTVASGISGSETAGMPPVDLYFPVAWNSYVQPAICAADLIVALDWLLQNNIPYNAQDLKLLALSIEQKDSQGRPAYNGSAFLAAVKAKYAPVGLPKPPAPISTPAPVTPVTVTALPVVTPPVATPPATSPVSPPVISFFNHGVSSAWSGPLTPSYFYFKVTGADSLTLTDPTGKSISLDPACASYGPVSNAYSQSATWSLTAKSAGGTVNVYETAVHGRL